MPEFADTVKVLRSRRLHGVHHRRRALMNRDLLIELFSITKGALAGPGTIQAEFWKVKIPSHGGRLSPRSELVTGWHEGRNMTSCSSEPLKPAGTVVVCPVG